MACWQSRNCWSAALTAQRSRSRSAAANGRAGRRAGACRCWVTAVTGSVLRDPDVDDLSGPKVPARAARRLFGHDADRARAAGDLAAHLVLRVLPPEDAGGARPALDGAARARAAAAVLR